MGSNVITALQDYTRGIYAILGDVLISTFLFGILTVLSLVSAGYLIRRGIRQPSTTFMLGSIFVLYSSAAMQFGTIIAYSIRYGRLLNDLVAALSALTLTDAPVAQFALNAKRESLTINISLAINVTVGDAIVWWRACVLWRKKSIIILGAVLVIGTFGLGIVSIVHRSSQLDAYPHLVFLFDDVYGRVSGLASLLTNVIATSLIGWKAWEHRKILRQGLGVSKGRWNTPAMRMLSLLVESGSIYCAMLVVFASEVAAARSNSSLASSTQFVSVAGVLLDGGCFVQILAIYPTTVIIMVAINWSLIDDTLADADSPSALPSHILPSAMFRSSDPPVTYASRSSVRSSRTVSPPDTSCGRPGDSNPNASTNNFNSGQEEGGAYPGLV